MRNATGSGGRELDRSTRAYFEPRLGYDIGSVRIHTDSAANQSARAVNARAYTLGSDIVFGNGEFRPESESGRRLLAHELAHVAQFRNSVAGRQTIYRQPVHFPEQSSAQYPERFLEDTDDHLVHGSTRKMATDQWLLLPGTDETRGFQGWPSPLRLARDLRGQNPYLYEHLRPAERAGASLNSSATAYFRSNFSGIDADGDPRAYNVANDKDGLDYLNNALGIRPLGPDGKRIAPVTPKKKFPNAKGSPLTRFDGNVLTDEAGNPVKSYMTFIDRQTLNAKRYPNGQPMAEVNWFGVELQKDKRGRPEKDRNGLVTPSKKTIDGKEFFVSTTAFQSPSKESVNSGEIAYLARSPQFMKQHGLVLGDIGLARNIDSRTSPQDENPYSFFIIGDLKNNNDTEGSIRLAKNLRIHNVSAKNGGENRAIFDFVFFPNSKIGFPSSQSEINAKGAELLKDTGLSVDELFVKMSR